MSRKLSLTAFAATQCVFAALLASTPAHAADSTPPQYFFHQWTVKSDCTEVNAGPSTRVDTGLQFKVKQAADGTYSLQTINSNGKQWASAWNGIKLEYRSGTKMTTIPADFVCIAGSEASSAAASPLLAMSGYVQTAEPQYEQEHLYGLAKIGNQLEHVLIFPRDVKGSNAVVMVLESASSGGNVTLDDGGAITGDE